MANLTVSKYGGTITISVSSSPSSSTSYGTLPSYTSRNGNVITVSANTSYDREFSLNVTATTNSSSSYYGNATASSAWTVSQEGSLGPAPSGFSLPYTFQSAVSNIGTMGIHITPVSGSGSQGDTGIAGTTTQSGSVGNGYVNGDILDVSFGNDNVKSRYIGFSYAPTPSTYDYYTIAAGGYETIRITFDNTKTFYILVQN